MIAALLPIIGTLIERVMPDPQQSNEAKLQLMKLAQDGQLAVIENETKMVVAQIATNTAEASSSNALASSWRPAVGWVCVLGLFYTFLLQPILPWVLMVCGKQVAPLPKLENDALMTLLFGMLGLGSMRTYEKYKGVTR